MNVHISLDDRDHKNKVLFQPGDKVCCTRNGYLSDGEDEDKEAPEERNDQSHMMESQSQSTKHGESSKKEQEKEKAKVRLCNGEIFFIRDVSVVSVNFIEMLVNRYTVQ